MTPNQLLAQLIERIRSGTFDQNSPAAQQQRDAMAAKGYYLAYRAVMGSVARVLEGENAGKVADGPADLVCAALPASG